MKKKKRYRDFTSFIRNKFGCRVQKVSINAGFTCPNKDGTKGIEVVHTVIIILLILIIVNLLNLYYHKLMRGLHFFLKNINHKNI